MNEIAGTRPIRKLKNKKYQTYTFCKGWVKREIDGATKKRRRIWRTNNPNGRVSTR
jgi:hypothetical protein